MADNKSKIGTPLLKEPADNPKDANGNTQYVKKGLMWEINPNYKPTVSKAGTALKKETNESKNNDTPEKAAISGDTASTFGGAEFQKRAKELINSGMTRSQAYEQAMREKQGQSSKMDTSRISENLRAEPKPNPVGENGEKMWIRSSKSVEPTKPLWEKNSKYIPLKSPAASAKSNLPKDDFDIPINVFGSVSNKNN